MKKFTLGLLLNSMGSNLCDRDKYGCLEASLYPGLKT